MNKTKVLAVGPGSPDYMPPLIMEQARQCDLLVGGQRNLKLFNIPGQEKVEIKGKLGSILKLIGEKAASNQVGVLVSGDAGIFSILPRLVEAFGRQTLDIYPGISSVQYMFARLGFTWQGACLLSLHGRDLDDLPGLVVSENKMALFTDRRNSPSVVCRALAEAGLKNKKVYIGEDLSYPEEKISCGKPEDFFEFRGSDLNLVVIVDE